MRSAPRTETAGKGRQGAPAGQVGDTIEGRRLCNRGGARGRCLEHLRFSLQVCLDQANPQPSWL